MKKAILFLLTAIIVLSLSACGTQSVNDNSDTRPKTSFDQNNPEIVNDSSDTQPETSYDQNDPESILNAMDFGFEYATKSIMDSSATAFDKIGDSYDSYDKNKAAVTDFYKTSLETAETLYATIETISIDYFKNIARQGLDEYNVWDNSMEAFYDAWDDGMDDFYEVWDGIYDDIYEKCDDLIDEATDTLGYAKYSEVWSEMYSTHSDSWSAMYSAHSDAWSKIYQDYSSIWSGFYNGNDDVDAILKAAVQANNEDQTSDSKVDNTDGQPSTDAKPIDDTEHESDNFTYLVYSDGTIEITDYKGNDSSVTISSEIDGYQVSRIGDSAFEDCTTMESIIIWPDIIRIGKSAFKGCSSLKNISISSSVTEIENSVFEGCSKLETAIIWGDITSFGDSAFKGCSSLTSISIPSSTKIVGTSAFEGCTNLESVIFWGGEVIEAYAFKDCINLSGVSIPSETKSIGVSAFEGCSNLESVIIWGDDTSIALNAFANCPKLKNAPRGTTEETSPATSNSERGAIEGIRPEFKEAMDSYEAFYDVYCAFLKQYSANPTNPKLLGNYTNMLSELADMDEKFEAWENEEMSIEELEYYWEVSNRITLKLLDVAG